jgi:hypothetical protein
MYSLQRFVESFIEHATEWSARGLQDFVLVVIHKQFDMQLNQLFGALTSANLFDIVEVRGINFRMGTRAETRHVIICFNKPKGAKGNYKMGEYILGDVNVVDDDVYMCNSNDLRMSEFDAGDGEMEAGTEGEGPGDDEGEPGEGSVVGGEGVEGGEGGEGGARGLRKVKNKAVPCFHGQYGKTATYNAFKLVSTFIKKKGGRGLIDMDEPLAPEEARPVGMYIDCSASTRDGAFAAASMGYKNMVGFIRMY